MRNKKEFGQDTSSIRICTILKTFLLTIHNINQGYFKNRLNLFECKKILLFMWGNK